MNTAEAMQKNILDSREEQIILHAKLKCCWRAGEGSITWLVGRQKEGSGRFKLKSWDDWVGSYTLNRQVKLRF